jgi:methionine biosynthesis protein MetW
MPSGDRAAMLCSRVLDEVEGRIESMLRELARPSSGSTLLDIGCWDGSRTIERGRILGADRLLGVEVYEGPAQEAAERGIEVARIDLEAERLPFADGSADVVVCNQVLEHLKNIWLPMSEMHRVLRLGGHAILSVPNLGSLHNRILLALGRQPTSIRVFGPHVRGYTLNEFSRLVERGDGYAIDERRGAGFYPVPSPWSRPLSAVWAGASHTFVVLARKTSAQPMLSAYLDEGSVGTQTFYGPSGAE